MAALSVAHRPSDMHVPPIFSKQKNSRNFYFSGDIALDKSNYGSKFEI